MPTPRITCGANSAAGPPDCSISILARWPRYERCFAVPATVHATCEDYRAAATIDLDHVTLPTAQPASAAPCSSYWGEKG